MKAHLHISSLCNSVGLAGAISVGACLCACRAPAHVVSSAGDTAAGAVRGAGKAAASATRAATKTATSAVGTAGKVVHSGLTAVGEVAKASVGAAADVVTAPFVLLKDTKSGKTCRVPWREGMTLAVAMQEAKVNAALSALTVLRGKEEYHADESFALKPGDVVELTAQGGLPALVAAGAF